MPNMSRKHRFVAVLLCIILVLGSAIIFPTAENREGEMIFQTTFLTMYFIGEIRLVTIGRESVGRSGKAVMFTGTVVSFLTGLISLGLSLKRLFAETGDNTPIPLYFFIIGTVAGLGYLYVLYDEKAHEGKE